MSYPVEGFVSRVFEKSFPRKNGGTSTAYSFKVELPNGQELNPFFRFGYNAPPFKQGDYIRFQANDKDANSAVVVEGSGEFPKNPPARSTAQQSEPRSVGALISGRSNASAKDTYWAEKDRHDKEVTQPRIQYQNARTAAIQTIGVLLANDALPAAKAATKAGQAARYEVIIAAVNKLTVQFYMDTETFRLFDTVADAGVITPLADKDAELPETEADSTTAAAALGEQEPDVEDPEEGAAAAQLKAAF